MNILRKQHRLQNNGITYQGLIILLKTLSECDVSLSLLSLSGNELDNACIDPLVQYLKNNKTLSQLHLNYNKFTGEEVIKLADVIIGNTALKQLHVMGVYKVDENIISKFVKMIKLSSIENFACGHYTAKVNQSMALPLAVNFIRNKSNHFDFSGR